MAVLFVTHDLAAARLVADRIAVMYLGRIVELGPAVEITGRPAPLHQALLSAVPGLDHARPASRASRPTRSTPPGCAFHPRCPLAVASCSTEAPVLLTFGGHAPWSQRWLAP